MRTGTDKEGGGRRKKLWQPPRITEVGDLQTLVQSLTPGKSSVGMDGSGQGGGEEMCMDCNSG
jgi:hypothetical protein